MKRKFPGFNSLFQFVLGVICINGKFTVVNPVLIALVYLATSGSTSILGASRSTRSATASAIQHLNIAI